MIISIFVLWCFFRLVPFLCLRNPTKKPETRSGIFLRPNAAFDQTTKGIQHYKSDSAYDKAYKQYQKKASEAKITTKIASKCNCANNRRNHINA